MLGDHIGMLSPDILEAVLLGNEFLPQLCATHFGRASSAVRLRSARALLARSSTRFTSRRRAGDRLALLLREEMERAVVGGGVDAAGRCVR